MQSHDELAPLLRQLNTFSVTVRELLRLNRQTATLEAKLSQVEKCVCEIPEEETILVTEWRHKLAIWWRQYAQSPPDTVHHASPAGVMMNTAAAAFGDTVTSIWDLTHRSSSLYASYTAAGLSPGALHDPTASLQMARLSKSLEGTNNLWKWPLPSGLLSSGHSSRSSTPSTVIKTEKGGGRETPTPSLPSVLTVKPEHRNLVDDGDHSLLDAQLSKKDPLPQTSATNKLRTHPWANKPANASPADDEALLSRLLNGDDRPKSPVTIDSSLLKNFWSRKVPPSTGGSASTITTVTGTTSVATSTAVQSKPATVAENGQLLTKRRAMGNTGATMTNDGQPKQPPQSVKKQPPGAMAQEEDSAEVQQRKTSIRNQVASEFAPLDKVLSIEGSVDAFRCLVSAVIKADRLSVEFWDDHRLQSDLLTVALPKLPATSVTSFLNSHKAGKPKTVRDLNHFLASELNAYIRTIKARQQQQQPKTSVVGSAPSSKGGTLPEVTTSKSTSGKFTTTTASITKAITSEKVQQVPVSNASVSKDKTDSKVSSSSTLTAKSESVPSTSSSNSSSSSFNFLSVSTFCFKCFTPGHAIANCPKGKDA